MGFRPLTTVFFKVPDKAARSCIQIANIKEQIVLKSDRNSTFYQMI